MPDAPEHGQAPTGDLTFLEGVDPVALDTLAEAGIEEGDFNGDEHGVPSDLVELYEVLEWDNAVADSEGRDLPHPDIGVPPPNTPGVVASAPFHSRADWGARPPRSISHNVRAEGNTAHYGGPSPWSGVDRSSAPRFYATADHARCPTIMRAYQRFHLDSRGWADFAYSSGVCPHGHRYEGRGPGVRTAAQGTNDGNFRSYATCYLAGDGDPLPDQAKHAYVDEGARLKANRWGHRDWKATACPGAPLYAWARQGFPRPGTPAPKPAPTPAPSRPTLKVGSRGETVKLWQTILAGAGLLPKSGIDGVFGPKTEAATRRFQAILRVAADGIVGPVTWSATDKLFRYLAAMPKPAPAPAPRPILKVGSRGEAVRVWQTILAGAGLLPRSGIDGIFGTRTRSATIAFQRKLRVTPDGIVGPRTYAATDKLFRYLAAL